MDNKTRHLIRLIKKAQNEYAEDYLVVAIPGFLSKKFIAYCAMHEDLKKTLEYIKLLRTDVDPIIKSALTYSLISLYGKCYTDASKNNFPKLEPKNLFKDDNQLIEIHNFLMDLRHQFIAHRGNTESEIGVAYMAIPKKEGVEQSQVNFSQIKLNAFSPKELDKIETLINYVVEYLKQVIKKNGQKIYEAFFEMFTPDQIVLMLMNNAKQE
ncbi:hypothetical protein [Flavobacterium sp. ASV13]|uniref:hypothetical protein n=1 Tax=Flavobacterium sp. ASV13 TaxID=1506583 RepID=UPI0005587F57|nr:hypothetical protein [Flavobacterium sp. ASV13]